MTKQEPGDLNSYLAHRSELHQRVAKALEHMGRERAISILCDWIGTDRLEADVLPMLEKD